MQSILTHLLAQAWAERPDKPTALGTPLRYSGALGCQRQMGYTAFKAIKSDPPGIGDAWAPGIGTTLHSVAQEAIHALYPTAQFEVRSKFGEFISGDADALVDTESIRECTGESLGGTHTLWEFKTMGEWQFDKQMGYNRKIAKIYNNGEGPKISAITQAGMNALGIESQNPSIRIETLLMGSVCTAAISVQKAAQMGVEGFGRFGQEFRIARDEWEPLALNELSRMNSIATLVKKGTLPDRLACGDSGGEVYLNPRGGDWQCHYCPYTSLCVRDGEDEKPSYADVVIRD